MNRIIVAFLLVVCAGLVGPALAGPAEEVADISAARGRAFQEGNVEGYTEAFADNATFLSSFTAFRLEGKAAIKSYFSELFLLYPRRHLFIRQPVVRVFNDDLVVQDGYAVLSLRNEAGETKLWDTRYSVTWAKIGGKWQIVGQHVSRAASQ